MTRSSTRAQSTRCVQQPAARSSSCCAAPPPPPISVCARNKTARGRSGRAAARRHRGSGKPSFDDDDAPQDGPATTRHSDRDNTNFSDHTSLPPLLGLGGRPAANKLINTGTKDSQASITGPTPEVRSPPSPLRQRRCVPREGGAGRRATAGAGGLAGQPRGTDKNKRRSLTHLADILTAPSTKSSLLLRQVEPRAAVQQRRWPTGTTGPFAPHHRHRHQPWRPSRGPPGGLRGPASSGTFGDLGRAFPDSALCTPPPPRGLPLLDLSRIPNSRRHDRALQKRDEKKQHVLNQGPFALHALVPS